MNFSINHIVEVTRLDRDRLLAQLAGDEGLSFEEIYECSISDGSELADLLTPEQHAQLVARDALSVRELENFDGVSEIHLGPSVLKLFNTRQSKAACRVLVEMEHAEEPSPFVRLDCLSGVSHLIRARSVDRLDMNIDLGSPPPAALHPDFQFALDPFSDAVGKASQMTPRVQKVRSAALALKQRVIERAIMEVSLLNGQTLNCQFTHQSGSDDAVEVFERLERNQGAEQPFVRLPLTDDADEAFFVRKEAIQLITLPAEHLMRYRLSPMDQFEPT